MGSKILSFKIIEVHTDLSGEYSKVLVVLDDCVLCEFGDFYHDKGHVKADAFAYGYSTALKKEYTIKNEVILERDNEIK